MIPEIGQFALILALLVAFVQATMPMVGAHHGNQAWMAIARPAALVQLGLVAVIVATASAGVGIAQHF